MLVLLRMLVLLAWQMLPLLQMLPNIRLGIHLGALIPRRPPLQL
jgi:hypothetical protein